MTRKQTMPWQHYYQMINATVQDGLNNNKDLNTIIKETQQCDAYKRLKYHFKNFDNLTQDITKAYNDKVGTIYKVDRPKTLFKKHKYPNCPKLLLNIAKRKKGYISVYEAVHDKQYPCPCPLCNKKQ